METAKGDQYYSQVTGDNGMEMVLKLIQKGQRKKNQKVNQKTIKRQWKLKKKPYDFKKLSNKAREWMLCILFYLR